MAGLAVALGSGVKEKFELESHKTLGDPPNVAPHLNKSNGLLNPSARNHTSHQQL